MLIYFIYYSTVIHLIQDLKRTGKMQKMLAFQLGLIIILSQAMIQLNRLRLFANMWVIYKKL